MEPKRFVASEGRAVPIRALARMAATGIHLLRGVPRDLRQAARERAGREGTTLHVVLRQALREYAAGTWTPAPDPTEPSAPAQRPPGAH